MKIFNTIIVIFVLGLQINCIGQTRFDKGKIVGGGCDGCELMYEGIPKAIPSISYSPGWDGPGTKLLITGKVYKDDCRTPQADVIIYYWPTDHNGSYSPGKNMNQKAKRHGHIRGWLKSDKGGNYSIYPNKPAPYSNQKNLHISTFPSKSQVLIMSII
jgi:protocatechuate 3,4-dioxygenase beta subunit